MGFLENGDVIQGAKIAYTTYKCTPTNVLCTQSFWKPYKVLYANIKYFHFLLSTLTRHSSFVEDYFDNVESFQCFYNLNQIYFVKNFYAFVLDNIRFFEPANELIYMQTTRLHS